MRRYFYFYAVGERVDEYINRQRKKAEFVERVTEKFTKAMTYIDTYTFSSEGGKNNESKNT